MRRGWVRGALLVLLLGPFLHAAARPGKPRASSDREQSLDALDLLFHAAAHDPSAVVPLILEASRRIPEKPTAEGHRIAERLRPFLKRAFFGPEQLPDMAQIGIARYRVKKGDVPIRIAARYRVGHALLPELNAQYDERRLKIGSRLKVIDLS